jgi:hypothetical protein
MVDEILTGGEVQKLCKVGRGAVANWRKNGKLQAIKISPRCYRYKKLDVLALLNGGCKHE